MISVFSFTSQRTPAPLFNCLYCWATNAVEKTDLQASLPHVNGWIVLGTSQRVELVFEGNIQPSEVCLLISRQPGFPADYTVQDLGKIIIHREREKARLYCFRLAAGLESPAVGEHEITEQLKKSWLKSLEHDCSSPFLNQLLDCAISTANRIRKSTTLSKHGKSFSDIVYQCIADFIQKFPSLKPQVLYLGEHHEAKICRQKIAHLHISETLIIRCAGKARRLAEVWKCADKPAGELTTELNKASIIVNFDYSFCSELNEFFGNHQAEMRNRLLIDLSFPSCVSACNSPAHKRINVSTINQALLDSRCILEHDIEVAEQIIAHELNQLRVDSESDFESFNNLLEVLRGEMEHVRLRHVELHSKRFSNEEYEQLHKFSRSLTSALMHKLSHELDVFQNKTSERKIEPEKQDKTNSPAPTVKVKPAISVLRLNDKSTKR